MIVFSSKIWKQVARLKQLLLPGVIDCPPVPTRVVSTLPKKVTPKRIRVQASDAELSPIWLKLCNEYFPAEQHLTEYSIVWSNRRQKRTLGSCNLKRKKVIIASELRSEALKPWCEAVVYHEMCHAVLGVTLKVRGLKTPWHGRAFRALERRHPKTKELAAWMRGGGWLSAIRSARAKERWGRS